MGEETPVWSSPDRDVRLRIVRDEIQDEHGTAVAVVDESTRLTARSVAPSWREEHRKVYRVRTADYGQPLLFVSYMDYARLSRRKRRKLDVDFQMVDSVRGEPVGAVSHVPVATPHRYVFADRYGRPVGSAVEEPPRDSKSSARSLMERFTDDGNGEMVLLRVALFDDRGSQVGWLDKTMPPSLRGIMAGFANSAIFGTGFGWRLELAASTPEPLRSLCVGLLCVYEKARWEA